MQAPDVLIVGGGVIGASIAYHLAEEGVLALVLERGRAGGHASLASAGLLHPLIEPRVPKTLRALSEASFACFPSLVARLRELSGIDAQYQVSRWLRVALEPDQMPDLQAHVTDETRREYALQLIDGQEAHTLEPALSPAVVAALYLPRGAQVYAPALLSAYLHSAAKLGAEVRFGVEVQELCLEGARVIGARTADGEKIAAGHTVLAGGAWTPRLAAALGLTLPVYPLRGQILALHAIPPPVQHIIFGPGAYLAPKVDGSVLVGATYEDAGFDDRLTAAGLSGILLAGQQIAPVLAGATFRQAWVGLRPASRDEMPILGPAPGWDGITLATGHTAEGILLSPITGALIAQQIRGEPEAMPLAPFGMERFASAL